MLHFNVFQAGSTSDATKTFEVNDPRATTVGALKQQLFPDAVSERKSVRFISRGRVLDDAAALSGCGLGRDAHIHVMVSERQPVATTASSEKRAETAPSDREEPNGGRQRAALTLLAVMLLIAGGLAGFSNAYHRRFQLSMQASQTLCIGAAIWAYVVLCHGLPSLCDALCDLCSSSRSSSSPDSEASASPDSAMDQPSNDGLRQRR